MKYFTLQEAEALIPELEEILKAATQLAAQAQAKAESIRRLEERKTPLPELAIEKAQLEFLVGGVNDSLRKIADLGAFPKGLDPALVGFPHRLGGREVYLCWKRGEKRIAHYHGLEEGFSGRKALPRPRSGAPDNSED